MVEEPKTNNAIDNPLPGGLELKDNPEERLDMSKRSRLNKRLEKQSRRNLILSILGMLLLALLLFRFGIPLIADLGFLSSQIAPTKKEDMGENKSKELFLSPPSLDQTFDATNSARIKISGTSFTGKQVAIYLNGSLFKKIGISEDGNFTQSLTLSDGENIIKAKSIDGEKQSEFSDSLNIVLKNEPPSLSIDTPSDSSTIKNSPVNVTGKSDPDTKITVNGFWAISGTDGGYSYSLHLQSGENEIKVVSVDPAGNKAEKSIKVNYSP